MMCLGVSLFLEHFLLSKKNMFVYLFTVVLALSVATNLRNADLDTFSAYGFHFVWTIMSSVWLLHIRL